MISTAELLLNVTPFVTTHYVIRKRVLIEWRGAANVTDEMFNRDKASVKDSSKKYTTRL